MKVANPVKLQETFNKRHSIAAMLHRAQSLSFDGRASALDNFSMSDCYNKLVEIVPTIPRDRKVSRVEILQHVIDYIQDLQTALDNQAMKHMQHREASVSSPNRTPFSALQATSSGPTKNVPLTTQVPSVTSHEANNRGFVKQISCSTLGQKSHPYDTPESSPESQPCSS